MKMRSAFLIWSAIGLYTTIKILVMLHISQEVFSICIFVSGLAYCLDHNHIFGWDHVRFPYPLAPLADLSNNIRVE